MWLLDSPLLVAVLSFAIMLLALFIGERVLRKRWKLSEDGAETFRVVLGASLTLAALLIGFGFSMAVSRYDQRKAFEEAEANAIGTAYLRADLLPAADADRMRAILREYFGQRVRHYALSDAGELRKLDAATTRLQAALWAAVAAPATAAPAPSTALAAAAVNDVINAQGYAQAAMWNRIPPAAWILMLTTAAFCHALVGYGARGGRSDRVLLGIFALVLSTSFFLIADIDSPRGGLIRVEPENLRGIAGSLRVR